MSSSKILEQQVHYQFFPFEKKKREGEKKKECLSFVFLLLLLYQI